MSEHGKSIFDKVDKLTNTCHTKSCKNNNWDKRECNLTYVIIEKGRCTLYEKR